MMANCSVTLLFFILIGVGVAAFTVSGVALVAYGFMRSTLRQYGTFMPFRAVEARILNGLVWIFLAAQVYFGFSIAAQVLAGRPVCNERWDGWTYYLSWSDWLVLLLLIIWPAVCQLVLLYTVNQSVGDLRAGREQRKPSWVPEEFKTPIELRTLALLEDIRSEVQDGSSLDKETLLGRIEEIRDATIGETRKAMREAKTEVRLATEEMKETVEEAVEEATNGVQAQNEENK